MACNSAPPRLDPTYAHLRMREPPLYQMPHMWLVILLHLHSVRTQIRRTHWLPYRQRRRRRRVDVRAQAVASMPASNIRSSF